MTAAPTGVTQVPTRQARPPQDHKVGPRCNTESRSLQTGSLLMGYDLFTVLMI